MRTRNHCSVLIRLCIVGVIVCVIVSRIVILLMKEAAEECVEQNTLTVLDMRGNQKEFA